MLFSYIIEIYLKDVIIRVFGLIEVVIAIQSIIIIFISKTVSHMKHKKFNYFWYPILLIYYSKSRSILW